MDPSASAAIEKLTKRLRRRRNRELLDAFSCIWEVVLISLFLLSYHSLGVSASVELVGEIVGRFLCLSSKPLPMFFIGNLIIVTVAVLSGVGGGKNGRSGVVADDVYGEYITRCRVIAAGGYTSEGSSGIVDEKRIVLYSASGLSMDRGKGSRTTAAGTDGRTNKAPPQRQRKAKKLTDVASPRGSGRLVEVRSDGIKTVEDMSNEEFNQSVEKYIAKTRRFLQEE